jgi:hypothetical protein
MTSISTVYLLSPHRWSYDQNIHSKVKPRAGIYLVMQYVKYSISIKENWTRSAPQFELQFTVATTLLKKILLKVVINTYKPSIIIPLSIHRSTNNIIIGEYEKLFIVVMEYSIHIKVQLIIFQPPRYSCNIVESGVKYHKLNQNLFIFLCVVSYSRGSTKRNRTILQYYSYIVAVEK